MRLLWLKSDYVLPPDTGGKIRTYNLLRELHRRCEVTYLAYRPDPQLPVGGVDFASHVVTFHRPEEVKSGVSFYLRVAAAMASPLPYVAQKYRSREIREIQRQWYEANAGSGHVLVILCDFLEMAENVDWTVPCPKVLFEHNVESMIWRRYAVNETQPLKRAYFRFESRRMAAFESRMCNRFDLVLTVSAADRDVLLGDLGVRSPVEVVETGVDSSYFAPENGIQPVSGRLLFLGSLDWMPNIDGLRWFVSEVYPAIKRASPDVSLHVVGRRPVPAVHRLANADPSIAVITGVPDVRPHMAQAELVVVPLRIGGGSRIKIYEAMAMGRPVISTTIGAEGLPLRGGTHLALADEPGEFARRVVELLGDEDSRSALAENGYRFVTANCGWGEIASRLHAACERLGAATHGSS